MYLFASKQSYACRFMYLFFICFVGGFFFRRIIGRLESAWIPADLYFLSAPTLSFSDQMSSLNSSLKQFMEAFPKYVLVCNCGFSSA